jgi:hypothetical protein
MNEIEVKRPSTLDVKAYNILKKIVSIIDNNPEMSVGDKGDILIDVVNILGKHGYNMWLNSGGIRDKNTFIEQFLKSLTNEQLIDIIEKLDKIKSSLFEIKVNTPTDVSSFLTSDLLDQVKDIIISYIVDLAKYESDIIEYLLQIDIVEEFLKDQMIFSNQEIERNGREILLSPNNRNIIKLSDIKDYIENTPNLKNFLEKTFGDFYFDKVNFSGIYSFCIDQIKNWYKKYKYIDVWQVKQLIEDAIEIWQDNNYSLFPFDIADDFSNELEDYLSQAFKKSDVIQEIKINSPTNFIFVPDKSSFKNLGIPIHKLHGHFSGKLYWMGKLITDRATVRHTYTDTSFGPENLQLALSKEKYDELDPNAKKKLIKSALSSSSMYILYLDSENFAVNEKG